MAGLYVFIVIPHAKVMRAISFIRSEVGFSTGTIWAKDRGGLGDCLDGFGSRL
jgi:hypothetical protein